MHARLIRLSMLAYPRRWRHRYGAELERLALTVMTANAATRASQLRVLGGLLGHGAAERARSTEFAAKRTLAVTVSTLVATIAISTSVAPNGALGRTGPRLSPHVRLGPGVSVAYAGRLRTVGGGHNAVVVRVSPALGGRVVSIMGGPAKVVMSPDSRQVLSVTRRRG